MTYPTWHSKAASRIAYTVSRSYRPRSCRRRTRVRAVGTKSGGLALSGIAHRLRNNQGADIIGPVGRIEASVFDDCSYRFAFRTPLVYGRPHLKLASPAQASAT